MGTEGNEIERDLKAIFSPRTDRSLNQMGNSHS